MRRRCFLALAVITCSVFLSVSMHVVSAFVGGDGTPGNPYRISTCTELQNMNTNLSASYILVGDVDCSATSTWNAGAGFAPIGSVSPYFSGSFNGAGYTISGLRVNRPSTSYVGLFARGVVGHSLSNIRMTGVSVVGTQYAGMIIGDSTGGTITNVTVAGTTQGTSDVGGLMGRATSSTVITTSSSSGTVTGSSSRVGGLIGNLEVSSRVSDSSSSASVSGGLHAGGLVGYAYNLAYNAANVVERSFATGNVVSADYSAGGLIGHLENVRVDDSYATGMVTANGATLGFAGGLIGRSRGSELVTDSYATGNATATGYGVGGFVGGSSAGTFQRSFATGTVSGGSRVGGFGGDIAGAIADSYARGNVSSGTGPIGSFVGRGSATIARSYSTGSATVQDATVTYGFAADTGFVCTNSFWDSELSSEPITNCGATAKTTADMKTLATFTSTVTPGLTAAWDFIGTPNNDTGTNDYWNILSYGNNGYPHMSYQVYTPPNVVPNTPASLGGISVVGGAWSNVQTPTFTATVSDPDISNQVRFRLVLDNNADFSSPLIDYTSGLQAQGTASFTVGQVAGTGSYAIGSSGQLLATDSYYWQVKAIDSQAAESSFVSANSGAVAFRVDATAPLTPTNLVVSTPATDATPTWSWSLSTDAHSGLSSAAPYTFIWSQDASFTTYQSQVLTTNEFAHTTTLADGTWYAAVYASDAVGNMSGLSGSGTITINTAVPINISPVAPSPAPQQQTTVENRAVSANTTPPSVTQETANGTTDIQILSDDLNFTEPAGVSVTLSRGQRVLFVYNGEEHSVTVKELGADNALVTIASIPRDITVKVGQTVEHDLHGDGSADVAVTLTSINNGLAQFAFRQLIPTSEASTNESNALAGGQSFHWGWVVVTGAVIALGVAVSWWVRRRVK